MQILGHCNQKGTMVDTEIPKVTDDMLSLDFPSDYAYIANPLVEDSARTGNCNF